MTEQRTPDELTAENELICEKLLGWTRPGGYRDIWWHQPNGRIIPKGEMPSFTTWADAGLILDAMGRDHHIDFGKNSHGGEQWFCAFENTGSNTPVGEDYAGTGPLAVRAAALDYIRRWK